MTTPKKPAEKKKKLGRLRVLHVAAINIALHHPHSLGNYISLFNRAVALKRPVKLRGEMEAILGYLAPLDGEKPAEGLEGEIYKFTRINSALPWFDMTTGKEADKRTVSRVQIPENLRPNLESIRFIFRPSNHMLYFVSKSAKGALGPGLVKKFFSELFQSPELADLGQTSLTVIPVANKLDQIINMAQLKTFSMEFLRPNPDDLGSLDEEMERRLRQNNAQSMTTTLVSASEKGLELEDSFKQLAGVAARNGTVRGHGRDANGKPLSLETDKHPEITQISYHDGVETLSAALLNHILETERRRSA